VKRWPSSFTFGSQQTATGAQLERRIRDQAKQGDRSASSLIRRAVIAYLDAVEDQRGSS